MNKSITVLILLFSLTACGEDEYSTEMKEQAVCDESSKSKRANFILSCIKNANPKSDEEPEDWIRECQYIAEQTYCELKTVKVTMYKPSGSYWRNIKTEPINKDNKQ
jgi:hypothetical protein